MGGFLHFVETELQGLSSDELKACGLGHAFTKAPASRSSKLALDGNPPVAGLLLWQSSDFKDGQGVNVDKQKWRLRGTFDGRRVWTGFNTDDPPTPEGLALGRRLRAFSWPDASGREWWVPIVGDVDESGGHDPVLPREVDFREDGTPTRGEVVARYRDLWNASSPLWAAMVETASCDTAEATAFAIKCLASLYRVSHIELGMLGVFSEEGEHSPEGLAANAIGYFNYTQWREAKNGDPLSSSEATTASDTTDGKAA